MCEYHMERTFINNSKNQSTWKWLVIRILLNDFSAIKDSANIRFTDVSFKHSLNRMNPKIRRSLIINYPEKYGPRRTRTVNLSLKRRMLYH